MLRVIVAALVATAPAAVSGYNSVKIRRDLSDVISGLFGDVKLGSLGTVSCNVARLDIVKSLADTKNAVTNITDPAIKQAAQDGLKQADDGIATIAKAIVAGQAPPAAGRDTVAAGLAATGNALMGAASNETAIVDAMSSLADSVKAGQDVVANC